MQSIEYQIQNLEKKLRIIEMSSKYSLLDIPGDKNEIFSYLIKKLELSYNKKTGNTFNSSDFTMFDSITNFSVLHMFPIQFFYKLLFETDILHPKILAKSSDEYLQGADINLLQAVYFYKTFYTDNMTLKEYDDTFTLLCLAEPNILLQTVDIENNENFWDIMPFIEFCTKEGVSINHIGKALSILQNEDKDIIKKFISANIYNFESFKPILNYCSRKELLEITHISDSVPEVIMNDFFEYIFNIPTP